MGSGLITVFLPIALYIGIFLQRKFLQVYFFIQNLLVISLKIF